MTTTLLIPAERVTEPLALTGDALSIADIASVARRGRPVAPALHGETLDRMLASRAAVERAVEDGELVYGVTTRFGGLADELLDATHARALQANALWMHATGAGATLPPDAVRAAMLVRANSHLRGVSGVRPLLVERLVALLHAGATPVVHEHGSIGASGDLVPLSYIAGAAIGHPAAYEMMLGDERLDARDALQRLGLEPIELEAKEGLAMINGTSVSTGVAALCVADARRLLAITLGVHALLVQALEGSMDSFDAFIHEQKPHAGQRQVADAMRDLLAGSALVRDGARHASARDGGTLVQDRYSIRCLPQFLGPSVDAIERIAGQVEVEANSATDNPICYRADLHVAGEGADLHGAGGFLHGGNFLAQYVALGMDELRLHLALMGRHLDASLALLMSPAFSGGLPGSLAGDTSRPETMGLKGVQLLANSLAPMLVQLASPIALHFPTHAEQFNQNLNSQSLGAGCLARRSLETYEQLLACVLLSAVQALDLRAAMRGQLASEVLSAATAPLHAAVYETVGRSESRVRALVWHDDGQRLDRWLAAIVVEMREGGLIAGRCTSR